ncbi:hypothetical protein V6N13_045428 [Hibiscus sabdariffa]|uniref:Uncharacterized protein n=1 Tax=Hibiscus sabdariffa TaxID=183260 RepID=A0ABR2RL46_9ROSI
MDVYETGFNFMSETLQNEQETDIRKGQWTEEEDSLLQAYVTLHGEGHWNSVARFSGLKRTGKSCRLRWLNYLRPETRRGNISLEEQLLILELHSRLGNRWSKIAQHLPGRTDNEIKNYWRTRVQKQAKMLECDVNSQKFRDAMRYDYIPRLLEKIRAGNANDSVRVDPSLLPEISGISSDSLETQASSVSNLRNIGGAWGIDEQSNGWFGGGDSMESVWNEENIWFLRQQLYDDDV